MEDTFRSRVDQVFGALGSSVNWSVSEREVERKEWKNWERNYEREDAPCASYYDEFVRLQGRRSRGKPGRQWQDDLDELGDEDSMDVDDTGKTKIGTVSQDEEGDWHERDAEEEGRQMRLMVGLDCTLDLEDEEDVYDKLAVGREGAGERIYMKEVKGSEEKVNTFNILPRSLKELKGSSRDPRANHLAARERLEEDAKEAATTALGLQKGDFQEKKGVRSDRKRAFKALENWHAKEFSSKDEKSSLEEERQIIDNQIQLLKSGHPFPEEKDVVYIEPPPLQGFTVNFETTLLEVRDPGAFEPPAPERNAEAAPAKKPVKRVRFALDTPEGLSDLQKTRVPVVKKKEGSGRPSVVPDYVKNPSKYIHYTLDWSDEDDEKQNFEAFEACRQLLGHPYHPHTASELKEEPAELPQKIEFRPRPKESATANCKNTCYPANGEGVAAEPVQAGRPVGIAAGYELEKRAENLPYSSNGSESVEMDVADETVAEGKPTKGPRKYRSRIFISEDEKVIGAP